MRTLPEAPVTSALEQARATMLYPNVGQDGTASTVKGHNDAIADRWLVWLEQSAGRRPTTVVNYASVIARYLDECVGNRRLDNVPEDEIEAWLLRPRYARRSHGKTASPATRARNVAILRSFYKWALDRELVDSNVAARLVAPTVRNRRPRAIPDAVWTSVWPQAAEDDSVSLLLALGAFGGLRRAELAELDASHVDPERRQLVGFTRKGGGDDVFPLGEVLDVWQQFMPHLLRPLDGDDLWGLIVARCDAMGGQGPLLGLTSPDEVNRRLKRFLAALERPGAFTPHALRHSFVTNLLRCSMPIHMVSELANHSSIDITMRYVKGGGGRVAEWRSSTVTPPS